VKPEPLLRFDGAVKRSPEVDVWLSAQRPELRTIAERWFGRLRACGDDVLDLMHDGLASACIGDVPFAYVGVFKAHVNVGFFYGAELPDPARLLQGSGRRMRHVTLKPGAGFDEEALRVLIDAAYEDIRRRLRRK
jgi:hypothetical protein